MDRRYVGTLLGLGMLALPSCAERLIDEAFPALNAEDVEPRLGPWELEVTAVLVDTCEHDALYDSPEGGFDLIESEPGVFLVDSSPEDFVCDLDGRAFTCPDKPVNDWEPDTYAIVIERRAGVTGHFVSAGFMRGQLDMTLTCTGAQCAEAGMIEGVDLPCRYAFEFTGHAVD